MNPWVPIAISTTITLVGYYVLLRVLVGKLEVQVAFNKELLDEVRGEIRQFRDWKLEIVGDVEGHEIRLRIIEKGSVADK